MSAWNAMTYEGKDTILRVVREEAERMFAMAEAPGAWEAPTACSDWQVRDIIGHLVDTTEGYFKSFETARAGGSAEAHGLPVMHELAGDGGRAFRGVPQAPGGAFRRHNYTDLVRVTNVSQRLEKIFP